LARLVSGSAHKLYIREPATIVLGLVPEQCQFLKAPSPRHKYRINFRHPAYAPDDNLLFTLYAWDHAEGGLHHGLAHNACVIFANNRFDGYLSRTCNGEHGERIETAWDDVLPAADYFFYVPYPPSKSARSTLLLILFTGLILLQVSNLFIESTVNHFEGGCD
jgi:hypothetical protein